MGNPFFVYKSSIVLHCFVIYIVMFSYVHISSTIVTHNESCCLIIYKLIKQGHSSFTIFTVYFSTTKSSMMPFCDSSYAFLRSCLSLKIPSWCLFILTESHGINFYYSFIDSKWISLEKFVQIYSQTFIIIVSPF